MSAHLKLHSKSADETYDIGKRLARVLRGGETILLHGTLGAGKTTLVQGLAQGLGIDDYVTSPTFTLVNEYDFRARKRHLPLVHVDLYRLDGVPEATDLGLDDYFDSDAVVAIEWAERAETAMPADRIDVVIQGTDSERTIQLSARGRLMELIERARQELGEYAAGH